MKKRIMVLLCCMIIAVSGCGNFSPGTGQETVQTVEKSLGDISYQVPEDWTEDRDQVTGNIYYRTDGYVLNVFCGDGTGAPADYLTANVDETADIIIASLEHDKNQIPRKLDIETFETVQMNRDDFEYGIREIANISAIEGHINIMIDDMEYEWQQNIFVYNDGIYFFVGIAEVGKDYSRQYDAVLDSIVTSADQQ